MLQTVTLTGADDSVNPEDLIAISKEFPFVEWGILIGSNTGAEARPVGVHTAVPLSHGCRQHNQRHRCGSVLQR